MKPFFIDPPPRRRVPAGERSVYARYDEAEAAARSLVSTGRCDVARVQHVEDGVLAECRRKPAGGVVVEMTFAGCAYA